MNMISSQYVGDINMETIAPLVRRMGIEKIMKKKLTNVEAIHVMRLTRIIIIGIIYGGSRIPYCLILWRKMKMKQKNTLMRMCVV